MSETRKESNVQTFLKKKQLALMIIPKSNPQQQQPKYSLCLLWYVNYNAGYKGETECVMLFS
jgi:hypothetical protein